jgi:hypothetical protein
MGNSSLPLLVMLAFVMSRHTLLTQPAYASLVTSLGPQSFKRLAGARLAASARDRSSEGAERKTAQARDKTRTLRAIDTPIDRNRRSL